MLMNSVRCLIRACLVGAHEDIKSRVSLNTCTVGNANSWGVLHRCQSSAISWLTVREQWRINSSERLVWRNEVKWPPGKSSPVIRLLYVVKDLKRNFSSLGERIRECYGENKRPALELLSEIQIITNTNWNVAFVHCGIHCRSSRHKLYLLDNDVFSHVKNYSVSGLLHHHIVYDWAPHLQGGKVGIPVQEKMGGHDVVVVAQSWVVDSCRVGIWSSWRFRISNSHSCTAKHAKKCN